MLGGTYLAVNIQLNFQNDKNSPQINASPQDDPM